MIGLAGRRATGQAGRVRVYNLGLKLLKIQRRGDMARSLLLEALKRGNSINIRFTDHYPYGQEVIASVNIDGKEHSATVDAHGKDLSVLFKSLDNLEDIIISRMIKGVLDGEAEGVFRRG